MRKILSLITIFLVATFFLAACQPAADEATEEPMEEMTEEPMEEMTEEPMEEMTEEPMDEFSVGTEDNPIVWVLVPSQDTEETLAGADEIAQHIEDETGLIVEPLVTTDYTGAVEALCNGEAHMGALNTFNYVLASARGCADVSIASSRFGSTFYSGQLITRADSGITSIADLAGKTFCRPDPTSTSGWVIPSIAMQANGINPETDLAEIVDAGGHDSVVIAVYNGDCDAGSTFVDARSNVEEDFPDVNDVVVVLEESAPIPNDNISFSPDVESAVRDLVVDAFLSLTETEEGLAVLNSVYSWSGMELVGDDFYDGFRQQLEAAGLSIDEILNPPTPPELGTEDNPIVWVLVPSQDTEETLAGADEIAQHIEDETGLIVEPLVTTDYTGAVEALCNNEAHMGALNTFNYVLASARGCADVSIASSRFGSTFYSGQLITRADSGITTIADLAGKTFCRPDPTSTSGWVIPSIAMQANGINPETDLAEIVDAGGHDSVVIAVYNGDCDAGSTFVDARSNVEEDYPDVNDVIVVIEESAPIPNDNISFVPDMDSAVRDAIVNAFLSLTETEEGLAILNSVYSWSGMELVGDDFYDGFRQQLEAAGLSIEDLIGE